MKIEFHTDGPTFTDEDDPSWVDPNAVARVFASIIDRMTYRLGGRIYDADGKCIGQWLV